MKFFKMHVVNKAIWQTIVKSLNEDILLGAAECVQVNCCSVAAHIVVRESMAKGEQN